MTSSGHYERYLRAAFVDSRKIPVSAKDWKGFAELIGIIAIVASLLFVGLQLKQDRRIAEAETLVAEQMADLETARFLEEKGEIWRRGLAGDSLSEDEHVSFDLLAYALFREQSHQLRRDVALSAEIDESQVRSYAFFVYQNPGLRRWFNGLVDVRSLTDRAYDLPD
jgi:hypothetical protein